MFTKTQILALALSIASAEAVSKGFNYGANKPDGTVKVQADFEAEFRTAKNLETTSGFNSARLYTMIQGTGSTPISAIPAAIAEETTLLLGLWASGGNMDNEIAALKAAINQYGDEFAKLVVGISVGSEDLYRNSETGVQANAGIGIEPEELVSYIQRVREAIAGTVLSDAPIGHVDTWNAWTNSSNAAVAEAVDWLGFDGYPFFQNTMQNSIDDAKALFDESVQKTKAVAGNKEVWITETGWPVSGDSQNLAIASVENAKQFWDEVGCPLFDNVNTWWYILQDASGSSVPNPSFGIVGNTLSTTPLFDLSCSASSKNSSNSASASASGSSAQSTGFTSATKPAASPSSSSGLGHGGSLGSSGSFSGGHYAGIGSSSVIASPSATPSGSAVPGSGSGSSSSGSASGSGSGSGAAADSTSGTGTSGDSTSSTSATPADFTGAGSRLSGSIFGAAMLVAALAVAL
ncbi:GPI-anchored beta-1,3-endoglucanase EglC [Aspergillus foveolatus]|uniref:GPI-anchored beta-1,3-endoglucanase EglC n=1 Tax=Aspergillus foveolatus TaxID=210207 RepID=UPI003CCD2BD6